jgi:hypothetical protein
MHPPQAAGFEDAVGRGSKRTIGVEEQFDGLMQPGLTV